MKIRSLIHFYIEISVECSILERSKAKESVTGRSSRVDTKSVTEVFLHMVTFYALSIHTHRDTHKTTHHLKSFSNVIEAEN